ncbi:CocE/NonD family hydrolase [bacterium]|nr:CocE/NonD family hydrolase [bacterium]
MQLIKLALLTIVLLSTFCFSYTQYTEMVPMRDGVHLATEVYLPSYMPEPFPVILERTPYNRHIDTLQVGIITDYYRYIYVVQNLRGRYESEGEPQIFLSDAWGDLKDGYDCLEWVEAQEWCDGNIGMFGASAPGMTQYMAAGALHPALKCMAPLFAGPSIYHYVAYNAGCFRKALVETWLSSVSETGLIDTVAAYYNYGPFWEFTNLAERYDSVNVPAFHATGWYDMYTDGQLEVFTELQSRWGNQKILITPYGHSNIGNRHQGDLLFPLNAERDELELALVAVRWYDYWLQGDSTEIMDEDPVIYYLTGDCDTDDTTQWNKWLTAVSWPVPGMEYVTYYLLDEGSLDTLMPFSDGADTIFYDPANPCPTIGGREYIGLTSGYGPKDQQPIEGRPDVLIYTTPTLLNPVKMIGKITMSLYASSNCLDTDFTVRITDVYPDGRSILMTDNIVKARHRNGLDIEEPLTPGEIYAFDIDVWSLAHVFNAGHRIRVIISSSNYPRFEKNPNTGAPPVRNDPNMLIAINSIYRSQLYPSRIRFPIISTDTSLVVDYRNLPSNLKVKCFPNPFNSSLMIDAPALGKIRIYDLKGKLIEEINSGLSGVKLWKPKDHVPTGLYLINVLTERGIGNHKVLYLK